MRQPLVSIIIPCFNAEPWLAGTLESALAQTWPRTEIIVVDDGSSDQSMAIAGRFEARGVRLLSQPNAGAGVARNTGLDVAQGDFVQYLDADDRLSADKIAAQIACLRKALPRKVATCRWARFQSDETEARFISETVYRDLNAIDFLLLAANENQMMHTAAWLVPRAIIDDAGPWDIVPSPNDDGEYFCRILLASDGIAFSPEGKSYYRSWLDESLSKTSSSRACRGLLHSMDLIARRLVDHEDSPRVHAALANHYQRIVYISYPHAPEVVAECLQRVTDHGGSHLEPEMGRRHGVARAIAWLETNLANQIRTWATMISTNAPPPTHLSMSFSDCDLQKWI